MSLQKAIEILTDFLNSGKVEPLASCECLEFEESQYRHVKSDMPSTPPVVSRIPATFLTKEQK